MHTRFFRNMYETSLGPSSNRGWQKKWEQSKLVGSSPQIRKCLKSKSVDKTLPTASIDWNPEPEWEGKSDIWTKNGQTRGGSHCRAHANPCKSEWEKRRVRIFRTRLIYLPITMLGKRQSRHQRGTCLWVSDSRLAYLLLSYLNLPRMILRWWRQQVSPLCDSLILLSDDFSWIATRQLFNDDQKAIVLFSASSTAPLVQMQRDAKIEHKVSIRIRQISWNCVQKLP